MTIHTSEELATLGEEVPTKVMDRGLLFIKDAEFAKAADVQFNAESVSFDEVLAIAAASQASFVSLSIDRFDSDQLREAMTSEDGEELTILRTSTCIRRRCTRRRDRRGVGALAGAWFDLRMDSCMRLA